MTTLKVGISTYAEIKARTLAVARGEYRVADEPKVWFTSTESFAKVLSAGNRELLRIISESARGSIEELAKLTGRAKIQSVAYVEDDGGLRTHSTGTRRARTNCTEGNLRPGRTRSPNHASACAPVTNAVLSIRFISIVGN